MINECLRMKETTTQEKYTLNSRAGRIGIIQVSILLKLTDSMQTTSKFPNSQNSMVVLA